VSDPVPGGSDGSGGSGSSGSSGDSGSPSLRREARATLDAQLEAVTTLDRKAFRLLQFAAALVSAVAGVLAVAPGTARVANAYAAAGVGLLLLAALTAVVAYAATPRVVGLDAAGLERALELTGRDRTAALIRGYADWVRYNDAVNRRAALAVTVTALLVAGGTVALALGVLRAFAGPLPLVVPLLAALAVAATALASGVHRQLRRVLGDDAATRPRPPDGALSPQSVASGGSTGGPGAGRLSGQRVGPDTDRRDAHGRGDGDGAAGSEESAGDGGQ
jgi:hypothetical protein